MLERWGPGKWARQGTASRPGLALERRDETKTGHGRQAPFGKGLGGHGGPSHRPSMRHEGMATESAMYASPVWCGCGRVRMTCHSCLVACMDPKQDADAANPRRGARDPGRGPTTDRGRSIRARSLCCSQDNNKSPSTINQQAACHSRLRCTWPWLRIPPCPPTWEMGVRGTGQYGGLVKTGSSRVGLGCAASCCIAKTPFKRLCCCKLQSATAERVATAWW